MTYIRGETTLPTLKNVKVLIFSELLNVVDFWALHGTTLPPSECCRIEKTL